MSRLFVLSGSSGCGKTTLMNSVIKTNPEIAVVQKYGTRRRRAAQDGVADDLCQVFDSPLPQELRIAQLLHEADGFISEIWEWTHDSYRLRKSPSREKQALFCALAGDPRFFENKQCASSEELRAVLCGVLRQFYDMDWDENLLRLKDDMSREQRKALSHILEDLEIRAPLIALGMHECWDDYGQKVVMRGTIDIAYALNKGQYGISSESIRHELSEGRNVITILSDFRVINRIKSIFGISAVALYVASAVDTAKLEKIQIGRLGIDSSAEDRLKIKLERLNAAVNISKWGNVARWIHELNEDWRTLKPDAESTAFRAERIKTFHTRYIDNITLFDHVVLNYTEGHPEDMTTQFLNIVKAPPKRHMSGRSPIFVVSAASNAGKGTMMEMLNLIGSDRVKILSKIAKRKRKRNDKKDGMVAIGSPESPVTDWAEWPSWWTDEMIATAKRGQFPDEYDFTWIFHGIVEYAVSDEEIRRNLEGNEAQIVISNTDQIEEFVKRYGDRVVFVLLYRLSSIEDTREYYELEERLSAEEAEARANEVKQVLQEYIRKIGDFSHVILNTTRPQDMYDQIFQLVEYYLS